MRIEPKSRECEFREIGFPQGCETGRGQVCDDRRVILLQRRVDEERRPGGGALARHVDEILPRDGHAIERSRRASLPVTLPACRRFLERPLAGDKNERRVCAIALDAVEEEFGDLDRVEGAFGDQPSDRRGGALFKVLDHVAVSLRRNNRFGVVRLSDRVYRKKRGVSYVDPAILSNRGRASRSPTIPL